MRIPVGGNTRPGQHLKEFLLYQISLEDLIPKVCPISSPEHTESDDASASR